MTTQSSIKNQIRVGAFVLIGAIIILVSLFMVGGDRLMKQYVVLHAHFDHVQGLNEGSVVSLQGIRIGNIQKFGFIHEKNQVDVFMKVDADFLPRITLGSKIEVRTAGALGDKFIFIIPGPPMDNHLYAGDVIEVSPPTDIMGVLAEKGNETNKIFDIINEVHKLTLALNNENRVEKVMKNFTDASASLKEASLQTKEMISEIRNQDSKKITSTIDKLDRIIGKIDRGEGTLGALINDPSLHDSLKNMVGGQDRKKAIKSLIRSSIEKSE